MGAEPAVWETNPARREEAEGYAVFAPEDDARRDYGRILDVSGDSAGLDGLIGRLAPGGEDEAFAAPLRADRWWEDPEAAESLRAPLTRLCAEYLTAAGDGRGPRDPVARFHLGNGARLERVNWLGNTASRGMRESFGLMVNYLYDLSAIEKNHETYANLGTVAASSAVSRELRAKLPPPRAVALAEA